MTEGHFFKKAANSGYKLTVCFFYGTKRGCTVAGVKDYVNNKVGDNREQIEYHVEQILKLIGEDPSVRDSLRHRPV